MNLIDERFLWLPAGIVIGWLLHALWLRFSRPRTTKPNRAEPAAAGSSAIPDADDFADMLAHQEPASSRVIDVGTARATGFNLKHADDLTIIEGIGPKIDDLLRANGVGTFAQLARLDRIDIVEILDNGGPNFRLTDPATWPEQALLASENRWTELKRMQKEMLNGSISRDDA